jgi:hypothetical protein
MGQISYGESNQVNYSDEFLYWFMIFHPIIIVLIVLISTFL